MLFTNVLYKTKIINDIEFKIIQLIYKEYLKYLPSLDLSIYLDVSPNTALNRIKLRNRDGENNITLQYLKNLRTEHDNYFSTTDHYRINEFKLNNIQSIIAKIDKIIIHTCLKPKIHNICHIL